MAIQQEIFRRARPWLGTLVEVAVCAPLALKQKQRQKQKPTHNCNDTTLQAVESAFSAIARVDALMSFQSATSELSHYNRLAPGQWLAVSEHFMNVLTFSSGLSALTDGVFDVCCMGADWHALALDHSGQKIGKLAPLTVDLSGVAKGYAVDCGVQALKAHGIESGWVNAGGDVCVFGALALPLQVRSPTDVSQLYDCGTLHNAAAATSASYLLSTPVLRQGASRHPVHRPASWTVRAPSCMVADALTKVLAASSQQHAAVFEHYGARSWIFD